MRALVDAGHWVPGKYQILFMNGCDTFAYIDGSLPQQRALLNPTIRRARSTWTS